MGPKFSQHLSVFLVIVASLVSLFLLSSIFWPAHHFPYHTTYPSRKARSDLDHYVNNFTMHHSPTPHTKRAVVFNDYVCKGGKLLDKIRNDPPLKHPWAPDDLQHNGWREHAEDISEYQTAEDLEPILDILGIPHGELDVRPVQWWQDLPFMDSSGHTNTPATGGHYHNDFIRSGNTIIAESNYSPRYQAGPTAEIPPLWRWSDVVWLLWTGEVGEDHAKDLKYIFRTNIITPSTREIMEHIGGVQRNELNLPWPGHTFDMSTDEGKALLATSHGVGLAFLIADHSNVIGRKIPFARIFTMDLTESDEESDSDDSDSQNDSTGVHYYILWELRETPSGILPSTEGRPSGS
ncbi:MAG: hypothetical protein Q9208_008092 [Pyrenodesmia sp. 3 TL-2023]